MSLNHVRGSPVWLSLGDLRTIPTQHSAKMDSSTNQLSSPQFSPSKAQAQQAQAKDWASVDGWLSRRYGSKRLPTFERNEDTLQVLLNLATGNESADEQRGHIDRIEKTALSAHAKRATSADKTWQILLKEPWERADLDELAESAVLLDCPDPGISTLSEAVLDLTSQKFTLDQQVHMVDTQLQALKVEQQRAASLLRDLNQNAFEADPGLSDQTSEHLRSAKHMRAKIAEYDDRTATIDVGSSSNSSMDEVVRQSEDLEGEQARISELQTELRAYQSLPANAKAARSKLENAREELRNLTMQRDRLFEQLAVP